MHESRNVHWCRKEMIARENSEKHHMKYPRFTHLHIDDDRLIIRMVNPIEGKRDCE